MEATKSSIYSRKRLMAITREGVIPVKVWQCYVCTWKKPPMKNPNTIVRMITNEDVDSRNLAEQGLQAWPPGKVSRGD